MTRLMILLALAPLPAALPAWAAGSVTVHNGGGEPVTGISFNGGESRLRRPLPPGAEARITYSTGCHADIRVTYGSGRGEDFPGVDPCTDPRITAGGGAAASPGDAAAAGPGGAGPTGSPAAAGSKSGTGVARTAAAAGPAALPAKAPPPVVPPWTGKSITKRFGGLD